MHLHCLCILALLLASGINLPLLVAAATSSSSSPSSSAGSHGHSAAAGSSASSPAMKPHIVLISLPWRGHMMPLINVGARLVARGFHVSMGVATEAAREFVRMQVGDTMDLFDSGDLAACVQVKRPRERQPRFDSMDGGFNATLHASLHPGAQLTDLFAGPPFAFQSLETFANASMVSAAANAPGAPNGVSLLMRTFADFQACMGPTLMRSLTDIMDPAHWEARLSLDKKKLQAEANATSSKGSAKARKAREAAAAAARLERENALPRISVPGLIVVDRFTFAGMDAALALNVSYVVNNPHFLLDLDSPSWSLPAPWSYLPSQPPLSLMQRATNILHRVNYRASMLRALALINANRAVQRLPALSSWDDYFASPLILTNSVWGLELHRSADAQGMHSHRNVNPAANGFTPRFKMTGPLLPYANSSATFALYSPASGPSAAASRHSVTIAALTLPVFSESLFDARIVRFMQRHATEAEKIESVKLTPGAATPAVPAAAHRIVFINLGEGDDVTRADVTAVLTGLKSFSARLSVLLVLPTRSVSSLMPPGGWPSFVLVVPFVRQFEFLSYYAQRRLILLVISHASLATCQEALASGLPLLLLPHPTVEQSEVVARLVRSKAVRVLQRVQLTARNVKDSVERMIDDTSYSSSAHHLSSVFQSSSTQGTGAVVSLLELAYRSGWTHLHTPVSHPSDPLPFWRHGLYGLPLDVLTLLAVIIALAVWACTHMGGLVAALWTGSAEKRWQ